MVWPTRFKPSTDEGFVNRSYVNLVTYVDSCGCAAVGMASWKKHIYRNIYMCRGVITCIDLRTSYSGVVHLSVHPATSKAQHFVVATGTVSASELSEGVTVSVSNHV